MAAVSRPPRAPGMPRFRLARAVTVSPTRPARCLTVSLRVAVAVVATCKKYKKDRTNSSKRESKRVVSVDTGGVVPPLGTLEGNG